MTSNRLFATGWLLLALTTTTTLPARADDSPAERLDRLQSKIESDVASGRIPSAAYAIARDGRIVREAAAGWADKADKIRSTPHTPYPLASATKPITATAVMMLHQRDRIGLDDPAGDYLGQSAIATRIHPDRDGYTIRQLLHHTSGLPTYARIHWRDKPTTTTDLGPVFDRHGFTARPPGTLFEYSNLGYGLLGEIVEQQSDRDLAAFFEKAIFGPLGMENASLPDPFAVPEGAARKHNAAGERIVATHNDTPGAGNVYASAHDLALFGSFHLGLSGNGTGLLDRKNRERMRTATDSRALYPYYGGSPYGLGWYHRAVEGAGDFVWHEGGMPGASTIIVLLPQRGIVATVLINATDANAIAQEYAAGLIRAFQPDFPVPALAATEGLERFSGQESLRGRWAGHILVDGAQLPWVLEFSGDGTIHARFPDRPEGSPLPAEIGFAGFIRDSLLIATVPATLPAAAIDPEEPGYLLLRLLQHDDELAGAAVAYATPQRLEHLLPFPARLHRAD